MINKEQIIKKRREKRISQGRGYHKIYKEK
jgi:hypothetical protein